MAFVVRAGRAGVAVPSDRRRPDRAGAPRVGDDAERIAALCGADVGRGRAARLPDLRAGSRRSRACARRGDRLLDDAAAPARVRAGGRARVGAADARTTGAMRAGRRASRRDAGRARRREPHGIRPMRCRRAAATPRPSRSAPDRRSPSRSAALGLAPHGRACPAGRTAESPERGRRSSPGSS